MAGLAVVAVVVGLTLLPANAARRELAGAREAMERGRAALVRGDAALASERFRDAERGFIRARGHARNPLLRLAAQVPVLGRTPDAVGAIADAGRDVAHAAVRLSDRVGTLPAGMAAFAPRNGRVPLAPFRALAPALNDARSLVRAASRTMERAPRSWLLEPVASAGREFRSELDDLDRSVDAAARLVDTVPAFLGAGEPRRYFFASQNPAELRGTGGLIGAYSILTFHDGNASFSPFRPVQSLRDLGRHEVPAPNRDYARNYGRFEAPGFWLNTNMTPDFPSAAAGILASYERATGVSLDGVVAADPHALAGLLRVTGPVRVEELGATLDADGVVAFTANRAYATLTDPAARKAVLGDAARSVFERFLDLPRPGLGAARSVARLGTEGHLLLYSTDPATQRAIEAAGVAGGLVEASGDFVALVENNAGGNKVDYFRDRTLRYSIRLGASGTGISTARVTLRNGAPDRGQPPYVIGPVPGVSAAGESVTYVNVYCARSCEPRAAERGGRRTLPFTGQELGHPFFQDLVRIGSGRSAEVAYTFAVSKAWTGDDSGGTYRLTVLNQPAIRPAVVRLEVQVPDDMRITHTNLPMEVSDSRAVWHGTPERRLQLEVSFERPLLPRMWRALVRLASRPVVQLGAIAVGGMSESSGSGPVRTVAQVDPDRRTRSPNGGRERSDR